MRINIRTYYKFLAVCIAFCCITSLVSNAQTIGGLVLYPESVETLQDNPTSLTTRWLTETALTFPVQQKRRTTSRFPIRISNMELLQKQVLVQ